MRGKGASGKGRGARGKHGVLTRDLPERELRAGDVGTVVDRHVVAGMEDGYSVEFFEMTGRAVAVVTVAESMLRAPTRADRPAVRAMAG